MIDIDTSILRQMSNAAKAAFEEMQAADSLLQSVTEHNDWGCKERGTINDHIRQSRSNMKRIRECGATFHQAIATVSDEFEETEKGIGSMFSSLDGVIGDMLSVAGGLAKKTGNNIPSIPGFKNTIGLDNNGRITPIHIADFQNLMKGMEG